ncbi:alpha/beta hydrolase [Paraferrimonas sedimenticola]|uniref:Esterase n=1 Tax=Paraferrimonas sedimenticola TaxID=375674 RepID=A0AA37RTZ4_9GAMM|nr:alpha/beta fold hydrolase [Paraferrimonas sedimenticola]GLP94862.1 esterase [Paraferrimonas sedimenticola]
MITRIIIPFFVFFFSVASQAVEVSLGKLDTYADFPSKFIDQRTVRVWLPEGYPADKDYQVLYMFDGQALFDKNTTWNKQAWEVDDTAGRLQQQGALKPFIVVAIDNHSQRRRGEYFPQGAADYLTAEQRQQMLAHQGFEQGLHADRLLKFLVQELKPFIDANYRVKTGPANTALMGSSMGGLISLYALSRYPDTFGSAACLSTHWPGQIPPKPDGEVPTALRAFFKDNLPAPGQHKIYFDLGTATLDKYYPPLQAKMDLVMADKGYRQGVDWQTQTFGGAEHTEDAWSARLEIPLTFLFGK